MNLILLLNTLKAYTLKLVVRIHMLCFLLVILMDTPSRGTPRGTQLLRVLNSIPDLNLTQLISEATHFFRDDCKPSCIDLIVTDQPNLVLESGVRPSLDKTVKHQITFCKMNFKIPPLSKYVRTIWHFNRANVDSINRAISVFPWEENLRQHDPNKQVAILNKTILNIMSNFIPNEVKTIRPREPE